ncbi:DNA-binding protein [Paenalcaligenes niemegkensis]|uniref:DNA-binding protein n=1 Tax=Paenalcaligenes niemegkensis TaxID=2895469 RepID=UPI001EE9802F|nr:DNA-binding protein [Paenalcaligenes niemegkensis]MCQ9617982.1 DNA-binding protein [Paenalcaligenes niemegkensis]
MTVDGMTTEVRLIERYGILLSLDDLAEVLKRSRDGLRIALHGDSEFARTWCPAKKKSVGVFIFAQAMLLG